MTSAIIMKALITVSITLVLCFFDCASSCGPEWWVCDDQKCISASERCDGYYHCDQWEDETDCESCSSTAFYCAANVDFKCIPGSDVCDRVQDCVDNADESNCDSTTEVPVIPAATTEKAATTEQDTADITPIPLPDCSQPIDVVIAVESSTRLSASFFQSIILLIAQAMSQIDVGADAIRIALLTFADSARVEFHLKDYQTRTQVVAAISSLSFTGGGCNTAAAIRVARNNMFQPLNGDRVNAKNYLIIITAGTTDNLAQALAEAQAARQNGIDIYAIATIPGVYLNELRSMTGSASQVFQPTDANSLPGIISSIFPAVICPSDATTEAPSTPAAIEKAATTEPERAGAATEGPPTSAATEEAATVERTDTPEPPQPPAVVQPAPSPRKRCGGGRVRRRRCRRRRRYGPRKGRKMKRARRRRRRLQRKRKRG